MKKHAIKAKDLTTIGIFLGLLLTSFTIVAAKTPVMTRYTAGAVLGDESENKTVEKAQEETKKAEEQSRERQKQQEEQKQEQQKQELEIQTTTRKIKSKVEDDGKLKVEVEEPDVKLKYEVENIKVASEEGELEFEHGGVRTRTNFPLSINPETKELVVTTPAGQKTVATLPDTAVQNMLSQGMLTTVTTESAQTTAVRLETFDGEPAYRIEGEKEMRLFGLVPIAVQTTAFVSPDSGEVLAQQRSLLSNILSFISTK